MTDENRDRVYVSAREAATLMGINRATIINWARDGRLPGIQYGANGIYRFRREDILAFIEASRLPGPAGSTDGDDDAG